jgi:predicted TIM-barrel enzyme
MVEPVKDFVCAVDGVAVAQARDGRFVHLDTLPEAVAPDHDLQPVARSVFMEFKSPVAEIRIAASEMLVHHAHAHPLSECRWSQRLKDALARAY